MTNARMRFRPALLCSLLVTAQSLQGQAQQNSDVPTAGLRGTPTERDGQHDFDFEIGTWKTRLSRRLRPLTGSTTWVEYEGTTVVRQVWNGRANLVELEVDGPAGHIQGLSLRLYDPKGRQWSLSFANSSDGTLTRPTLGEFKNGRGEFFAQEELNGRAIYVRFVVSDVVAEQELPESVRSDPAAWAACYGGAIPEADYLAAIRGAGFDALEIIERTEPYEKGGVQVRSLTLKGTKGHP